MRITAAISRDGQGSPILEHADLAEPRAGEILVRLGATGICHTDVRTHKGGGWNTPKPIVLGHEGAGVVESVGEGVLHLQPGDHVVLSGSSCGLCPSCLDRHPSYCREVIPRSFGGQRMDGTSALSQDGHKLHGHFFGQSSFATFAVVEARSAVRIAKDVPFEVAAPLGCGVITGAGAVFYSFALRPGQSIVVFGAGGVGLSAIMAARLAGATQIFAVDPQPERRRLAEDLGATASFDPDAGDVASAIAAAAPEGVDCSFITTLALPIFEAAIAVLGMRGRAIFVTSPTEPLRLDLRTLLAGGKSLRGVIGGDADPHVAIPMMIEYWRQGRLPIDRLINCYPFERIGEAFADCGKGAVIKPVLQMPGVRS
jgi:aryl-alcohol dehydrogenase